MPVGFPEALPYVMRTFRRVEPRTVLDIGCGYGFWGAVLRNYFGTDPRTGSIFPLMQVGIVGVEIWPAYRNPMWDLYNGVIVGRIEDHLDLVSSADLVVAIDVIEHLPERLGERILQTAKAFVMGVPRERPQGAHYGNEAERHLSFWNADDVRRFATTVTVLERVNPEVNPGVDYIIGEK